MRDPNTRETGSLSAARVCILAVMAGLLLSSCFPEPLEVDNLPPAPHELVVSTQVVSGQQLVVLLTRTFGALEASEDSDPEDLFDLIAVDDAVVVLTGPAGTDTLTQARDGLYLLSGISFQSGDLYRLYVKSDEFGEVTATTRVTDRVEFSHVEADLFYNGYDDTLAQITYLFEDPPEDNWYMLNVQEVERQDAVENLLNPRAFTVLLTDDGFNGDIFGEEFRVFPRDYQPGDTIAVSLANISAEYYRFMELRLDNRFNFLEFVSEPVNYPTNIVGGRGYFNLYVPDVELFVFDD